ncbi:hypothetical protein BH11VER1_BH11VER1_37760 [soil metagenome]
MLLGQAAQGGLLEQPQPKSCHSGKAGAHACCVKLNQTQATRACHCMDSSKKPAPADPVSIPSSSTREGSSSLIGLLPACDFDPSQTTIDPPEVKALIERRSLVSQPHVRLPVLFCTFLI